MLSKVLDTRLFIDEKYYYYRLTKQWITERSLINMLKEKKEYSRSIRMTQTIKNYVEQTEGNGFNDKL